MDVKTLTIAAMVVGAIALLPGWRLSQTAFFMSRLRILIAPLIPLVTAGLTVAFFWLPFELSKGKTVDGFQTLSDLVLVGIVPLGAIALAGYAASHFSEQDRPLRPLVAGAACFAIALLPILYFFYADRMHEDFEIDVNPPAVTQSE